MITTERESTVYVRWPLSIEYGAEDGSDIQELHVAAKNDPDIRPNSEEWQEAKLIQPEDEGLGRGSLDLAILLGPATDAERPADLTHDGEGDYQLWIKLNTTDESIVERAGTWEVA